MNAFSSSTRLGTSIRSSVLRHGQRRSIWGTSLAKPHTNTDHMPFNYLNKRAFTYKYVSYLGFGFALPWVAVGWRWYRPGGLKNP